MFSTKRSETHSGTGVRVSTVTCFVVLQLHMEELPKHL